MMVMILMMVILIILLLDEGNDIDDGDIDNISAR